MIFAQFIIVPIFIRFFVHSDFSLTPTLINDFSLNHKSLHFIFVHVKSTLLCAYHEKTRFNILLNGSYELHGTGTMTGTGIGHNRKQRFPVLCSVYSNILV